MRENRKKTIKYAVLVLILLLGIGYAALTAKLKVDGTVHIDKATWDVHFENVQVTEGSVTANPAPTTNNVDTTSMTYTINFTKPGDFYEFTVDVVNDGTIDAMVNVLNNKTYNSTGTTEITLPPYLTSTTTYNDGKLIQQNHLLAKGTSEKIKVRVEFKKDIQASDLPSSGDTTVVFKFNSNFKQADETACPKATTFQNDSWDTIQCNVKNDPSSYPVGATKEITLTDFGTHTLRVANNTTPVECSQTGFSQTACGFVLEVDDIIIKHRMNPYNEHGEIVNGNGNKGGWEYSEMRTYVNTTTYNSLPSDLKSKIIDTYVVSGHGPNDTSNFTTTDKIYLLSAKEVYGKEGTTNVVLIDTAEVETRQLDYYKSIGVTTSNMRDAGKIGDGFDYWLRTPSSSPHSFMHIHSNGNWYTSGSSNAYGVSPAFRIG